MTQMFYSVTALARSLGVEARHAGGDVETSPAMWLPSGNVSLAEGKRLVTERFLALAPGRGDAADLYACAV